MRAHLVPALVVLAACSSGSPKGSPSASASPPTRAFTGKPRPSQVGPSFLDDAPTPSAAPLPVASTPPGPPKASCDMRVKRAMCVDFYRPTPNDKGDCENAVVAGQFATTPCPSEKSIGYCTTRDGDRRHYYDIKASDGYGTGIDDAKLNCETRRFTSVP